MENNLQNTKISGAGTIAGGKFNNVSISGAGTVNGDVECNEFNASGAATLNGNLVAKSVDASGSVKIKGNVTSENIKTSGSAIIEGNVKTKKINISGSATVEGSLHGDNVKISGAAKIKDECEAEIFESRGGFEIGGLLNAGDIRISISGRCRAREIGGEKIEIRHGSMHHIIQKVIFSMFNYNERMETSIIEGDEIYLEDTTATIVRGNNITIGDGCRIGTVEYKTSLSVSEDSKVEKQIKVE